MALGFIAYFAFVIWNTVASQNVSNFSGFAHTLSLSVILGFAYISVPTYMQDLPLMHLCIIIIITIIMARGMYIW